MSRSKIKSLQGSLQALVNLLYETRVKNLIIGGIAASILGKARFTADIDGLILLPDEDMEDFLKKAVRHGFLSRITKAIEFARKNRMLLLKHKATGINIDLSLALLPFEIESLNRGKVFKTGKLALYLPTPEDLIIMKAVAHRPIDLEDIRSILEVNPNLDFKRIKCWVKEFAKILEMPEIFGDIKKLLPK